MPVIRESKRQRKASLTRALKQAAKAGQSVKSAEMYRDRIVLQFGTPSDAESGEAKDTAERILNQL
jgi:hypothetical protein